MKLNITYNGQTISIADGKSLTLKCKDLKARGNIMVSAVADAEETYILSGTWVFNEILQFVSGDVPTNNARFVSNSNSFIRFSTIKTNVLAYVYSDDSEVRVYPRDLNDTPLVWMDESYRTITFDGVQTVSKEFYDWFTANAVEKETYTLSGKYVFNPTLTFLPSGIGLDTLLYGQVEGGTLEFSLWNGATGSYNLMYLTSAASAPFPSDRFIAYTNGTWTSENLRYVDFGNTPQEVSETFYNFVNRNTVFLGGSN